MKIEINGNTEEVELLNDYGDGLGGTLFLIGNEFGWTHLVNANSCSDAEDAWLDEQKPIADEDLHQAYGLADEAAYLQAIEDWEDGEDAPDLDEAYRHQPNATGNGIVEIGHYHQIIEVHVASVSLAEGGNP